jgi:CBS-domain-containing membrane protein
VQEVKRVMADRQARRVPIIGDSRCRVGIVTQADPARDERDFDDHEVRRTIERIAEPTAAAARRGARGGTAEVEQFSLSPRLRKVE